LFVFRAIHNVGHDREAAIRSSEDIFRFVRKADIGAECSESQLPTVSTSSKVAANYGSGYALGVMRAHMEKVW
jgi:hypothetical protein